MSSDRRRPRSGSKRAWLVSGVLALAGLVLLAVLATGDLPTVLEPPGGWSLLGGDAPDEPSPGDPAPDDATPGDAANESPPDRAGADGPGSPPDGVVEGLARPPLVIQHVGDVNLDPSYVPVLRDDDPAAAWDGARATFATADLVLANLECAAADGGRPQPKQFLFRCDLAALPALREAGVDVVTLANNHSGDHGVDAMVRSVSNVEEAGVAAVGVGVDETAAYTPRMLDVEGWRVAVLGFGGVVPDPSWTARGDRPGQATGYDAARMATAVRAAAEDAEVVVVTVHWGEEGALEPREEDRDRADALVAAGADVVFGHHAHRLQPVERVDGTPVFWGLGNFVWPRFSVAGATTAVGEFVVHDDRGVQACLLPFEIDATGTPRPTDEQRHCV